LSKYIDDSLINHFDIELSDSFAFYSFDINIYERYNLEYETYKITYNIKDGIKYNWNYGENIVNYNCIWINNIIINKIKGNQCKFIKEKSNFNSKELYFEIGDEIISNYSDFIHILSQTYEDYIMYSRKFNSIKNIIDKKYGIMDYDITNNNYINFIINDNISKKYFINLENFIRKIIHNNDYNLFSFNPKQFINEIKNSDFYTILLESGKYIIYENNKFENKWIEFKRKFEIFVPKIVNRELTIKEYGEDYDK
jgi:hypothetical protein